MVARFQDGWLHVIWKWNKSICAWEYGIRVGWVGWVGKSTNQGYVCGRVGTLHSDRGAMVDLSYESGPKSEAGLGRHCCSDAENGDSPRMFASIMQMIVRPILMIT